MSEYLLQDSRSLTGDRLMFWANGGGYTSNLNDAQRYTLEDAVSQNQSRETDLPWPLAYLGPLAEWAVDHQYVKPEEVAAELEDATKAHLYARGRWNGNDLIFLTVDGGLTDDLRKAHAFPLIYAVTKAAQQHNNVSVIPHLLAVRLARKVVASGNVNIKQALKGAGIKLAKPPKRRSQFSRDRCGHCGVFISDAQRFQDCPRCEGSNAP